MAAGRGHSRPQHAANTNRCGRGRPRSAASNRQRGAKRNILERSASRIRPPLFAPSLIRNEHGKSFNLSKKLLKNYCHPATLQGNCSVLGAEQGRAQGWWKTSSTED